MIRCKNSLKHAHTSAPQPQLHGAGGTLLSWNTFLRAFVGYLLSPTVSEVASKGGRSGY